ncbi:MAG: hypothetical protein ABIR11_09160 [Candidatus Limnocylindrales bacterium]
MNTLAPKLVLTPLFVASTSLAGRRWGPALSGWLVALPLTSGPIALFIAIEAGTDVARQAAGGSLLVAALAFDAVGFAVPPMPPVLTYGLLLAAVAVFLATLQRSPTKGRSTLAPPAWDIPARVVVATVLVGFLVQAATLPLVRRATRNEEPVAPAGLK